MKGRKQMKALNKIYIDESRITELGGLADAIVPDNRIETSDVCYIRKDALISFLEKEKYDLFNWHFQDEDRKFKVYEEVINKIKEL